MKYWFDTEFMEDGTVVELLSIGVVAEDGREFYAESLDADFDHANPWVKENVLPHLWARQPDKRAANLWSRDGGTGGLLRRSEIARDLQRFVDASDGKLELWAYFGDYDWVVLCQLFGTMMDLPKGWPMFAMDVKQLCVSLGDPRLPEQTSTEHNALEDARWTRDAYLWLANGPGCGAKIRPFPNATMLRCEAEGDHRRHEAVLRDYAYPGSATKITWDEADRRNFYGEWKQCVTTIGCVLPRDHHGDCVL